MSKDRAWQIANAGGPHVKAVVSARTFRGSLVGPYDMAPPFAESSLRLDFSCGKHYHSTAGPGGTVFKHVFKCAGTGLRSF